MMRNVTWCMLFGIALVSLAAGTAMAQDPCLNCTRDAKGGDAWCEDFEPGGIQDPIDCGAEGYLCKTEIPRACNNFYLWFDALPSINGEVSCLQNHTPGGEQSFTSNDVDDTVHFFGDGYDLATSDFWVSRWWTYIPSGMAGSAFVIMNPQYEIDGSDGVNGPTTWSTQLNMTVDTVTDDIHGQSLPTILDQWVELVIEINFAADTQKTSYGDQFLSFGAFTEGGAAAMEMRGFDLFSNGSTEHWYDDISMCAAEVPNLLPPELRCQTIDRLESGCVDYYFSLTNVNAGDPIVEFWVDVEAGDGGVICTGEEDITPPTGWSAELCAAWGDGHALIRMSIDPPGLPVGGTVTGRVRVDPNGPTPTVTGRGFEVPPFSILMHAAQTAGNPDATCDPDIFCPTCSNAVSCIDNTDCEDFGVPCVAGFCEGVLRGSAWSAPTNVCTAFLDVPAMTTWAKAVLAMLLVGGGALLVLRSRRPVTV